MKDRRTSLIVSLFLSGLSVSAAAQPTWIDASRAIDISDGSAVVTLNAAAVNARASGRGVVVEPTATSGWTLEADDPVLGEPSGVFVLQPGRDSGFRPVALTLRPVRTPPTTEPGGFVVAQVRFRDPTGVFPAQSQRVYFTWDGTSLHESSDAEYLAALNVGTADAPELVAGGIARSGPADLQGLAPWDNPECADEFPNGSGTARAEFALTAEEDGAAGCQAARGADPAPWFVALALLVSLGIARWMRGRRAVWLIAAFVASGCLLSAATAHAEARSVYGYLSFWDTRDGRSDATGSRFLLCDNQDFTCQPGTADCCFTRLPQIEVSLRRGSPSGPVVSTVETNGNGWYWLSDANWQDVDYYLKVTFRRAAYPAKQMHTSWGGTSPWGVNIGTGFRLTSTLTYVANISINSAGDTVSLAGDLASEWTTMYDTFIAMSGDGETRYRRRYDSENTYDEYRTEHRTCTSGCGQGCTQDEEQDEVLWICNDGTSRLRSPSLALGRLYLARLLGCDSTYNVPYFPTEPASWNFGYEFGTSEGAAMAVALEVLVYDLTLWNPGTTPTGASLSDCAPPDSTNWNDASNYPNDRRSLWEVVDTGTTGADQYSDQLDLTLQDLGDGLDYWVKMPCDAPHHPCEQYWVDTDEPCTTSADCVAGQVCGYDGVRTCFSGDPHGHNIWDLLYNVSAVRQEGYTAYWQTMVSSPCMDNYDNSAPFTGGYHGD